MRKYVMTQAYRDTLWGAKTVTTHHGLVDLFSKSKSFVTSTERVEITNMKPGDRFIAFDGYYEVRCYGTT